ncbi:MAG: Crp/Fnr family transcriptional regulator [Desulfobacterales bacterium]|nr:Crp/Fnr family transcriptional regulator [Deltaproteobacteria bacterium]NNL42156.1 Crp/Fnr family transcriptional regulator [Desulfobacterales bacterium]
MSISSPQKLLNKIPLFNSLSDSDLENLSESVRLQSLKKGQTLFRKGDEGSSLYIIKQGTIKIVLPSRLGDEVIVTMFSAGDFLGEMALFDGKPRSADALAMEPSQIYVLNRNDFLIFLQSNINAMKSILSQLTNRLRNTDDFLESTCFLSVSARLAKKLLELAESYGQNDGDKVYIDLSLTQKEIGDMIGSTRESINKELKILRDKGLITMQENKIQIVDITRLKRRAY